MLGRALGWIATPPSDVRMSDDELEVYAVLIWATLIGLVTHASWVGLFFFLGIPELAIFNVASTGCFVAAVWLCRRGKLTPSLILTTAEVVAHAWAATIFLGVATAFHAHILLVMVIGILFTTMTIGDRIAFGVGAGAAWLALVAASPWLPVLHALPEAAGWFQAMNGLVFISVLAGVSLYHSWRVTLTRSSRRQTQEELVAAVNKTRVIVAQMADGIVAFSREMRVTALNRALASWLGEAEVDVDVSTSVDLALPDLAGLARRAMENDEVVTADVPLPGGRVGAAVASPLGEEGAVVLVRDVTAAKEVDRMKSEFTAMVSHELRTPLTSVLGFAKLVKKQLDQKVFPATDMSDSKVKRAADRTLDQLAIILKEGDRLTSLINDVLDIAKMDAGKMELAREPIAVSELVDRALAATSSLFEGDVACEAEVEPDLPVVVGDPNRLQQVFVNLISNAAKFTDAGQVTVTATRTDDGVLCAVKDTGPGIPVAEQELVFEKYRQAKGAMSRPGGTGLGLPICREIVHAHDGRIGVESQEGEGARFWFVLPIAS